MGILNLFIIPIILVSLFWKMRVAYIISLLGSLAAATFIFTEVSLLNILLAIAIFNLTPVTCQHFNLSLLNQRRALLAKRDSEKAAYAQMLTELTLLVQSNSQLDKELALLVELYKMMRDMSAVLEVEDILEIIGKKMAQHFSFDIVRLFLIDEKASVRKIKKKYELKFAQPKVYTKDPQAADEQIIQESLSNQNQKIIYLADKTMGLATLRQDSEILGVLQVEGLAGSALESFSILANQFLLEFRRVMLYQKIQELAITDGLTGLFARRYFLERLDEELKRSARHKLNLAFLMLDIDHFKHCNDNYGHLTGDAVLREVARTILACVREIDLVARYGGEEFGVLLPDTDKPGAKAVAERIRTSIDSHSFKAYDENIKIEVSIGVSAFPQDATAAHDLIDSSDQALYRAKQEGRNRVCLIND